MCMHLSRVDCVHVLSLSLFFGGGEHILAAFFVYWPPLRDNLEASTYWRLLFISVSYTTTLRDNLKASM